jgi:hypothetical protein
VAGTGRVNGGEFDAVIIGGTAAAQAWVFFGSAGGPSAMPDWSSPAAESSSGHIVSTAGDVTRVGMPGIIVGAPTANSGDGAAFVFLDPPVPPLPPSGSSDKGCGFLGIEPVLVLGVFVWLLWMTRRETTEARKR